jgi:hypothetical protein
VVVRVPKAVAVSAGLGNTSADSIDLTRFETALCRGDPARIPRRCSERRKLALSLGSLPARVGLALHEMLETSASNRRTSPLRRRQSDLPRREPTIPSNQSARDVARIRVSRVAVQRRTKRARRLAALSKDVRLLLSLQERHRRYRRAGHDGLAHSVLLNRGAPAAVRPPASHPLV